MFLGVPDPEVDPLVRGMDPDPDPTGSCSGFGSRSFYHQEKKVRKTMIPAVL
jgi:hypothetical protein